MAKGDTLAGYKLLHYGAVALSRVESAGIRIDEGYLAATIKSVGKKISVLESELNETDVMAAWRKRFEQDANLAARVQLAWVLRNHLGLDLERTSKGNYKTDVSALSQFDHPFIAAYQRIVKLRKALSTYLLGIQREVVDGYVHPFFNLHTVQTYRSSADSPNFQNIPTRDPEIGPMIRRMFIPRPGCELLDADYGGAEIKIAACYHKDPRMLAYIDDENLDLHRDMAAQCYKLPVDEVTKMLRYYGKNQWVFPQFYGDWYVSCAQLLWKSAHSIEAGTTVSGKSMKTHLKQKFPRGLGSVDGPRGMDSGTFIAYLREVQDDFWGNRFQVYGQWKKDWYSEYQDRGFIELLTGFICRGYMRKNEVINYAVQGSAFHCLLWSLIHLVLKELPKSGLKAIVVGQIHDSVVGDVPSGEVDDYKALVEDVMVNKLKAAWEWIITPMEVEFSRYVESWAKAEDD